MESVTAGQLLTLAVTVLGIAAAVAISALEKADVIELDTFMQVSGYMGTLLGAGLGGALIAKRPSATKLE